MRRIEARCKNAKPVCRTLRVLGEPSAAIKPGNGAFQDPAFWQDDESVEFVALDNLDDPIATAGGGQRGARPTIACVGEKHAQ